jgi:hypothetical protein
MYSKILFKYLDVRLWSGPHVRGALSSHSHIFFIRLKPSKTKEPRLLFLQRGRNVVPVVPEQIHDTKEQRERSNRERASELFSSRRRILTFFH